jgi:hypothetical protein
MNNEFWVLVIIFALLILLITFGDFFSPSGWTSFLSTGSNNISAKSIINTIKI